MRHPLRRNARRRDVFPGWRRRERGCWGHNLSIILMALCLSKLRQGCRVEEQQQIVVMPARVKTRACYLLDYANTLLSKVTIHFRFTEDCSEVLESVR